MMSLKVKLLNVAVVTLIVVGIAFILDALTDVGSDGYVREVPLWVPSLGSIMLVAGLSLAYSKRMRFVAVAAIVGFSVAVSSVLYGYSRPIVAILFLLSFLGFLYFFWWIGR